jgi:hypothetical protein
LTVRAWPKDKTVTLPDGMLECRDCGIHVFNMHDFNIHVCKPELKPKPYQAPPTPESEQRFQKAFKEWF